MQLTAVEFLKTVKFMHPVPGLESKPYARGGKYEVPPDAALWLVSTGHARVVDQDEPGGPLPQRPGSGALSSARKALEQAEAVLGQIQARATEVRTALERNKAAVRSNDTAVSALAKLSRESNDLETEAEALKARVNSAANAAAAARQEHSRLAYAEARHVLADAEAALSKAARKALRALHSDAERVAAAAKEANEHAGAAGVSYRTDDMLTDPSAAAVCAVRGAALAKGD